MLSYGNRSTSVGHVARAAEVTQQGLLPRRVLCRCLRKILIDRGGHVKPSKVCKRGEHAVKIANRCLSRSPMQARKWRILCRWTTFTRCRLTVGMRNQWSVQVWTCRENTTNSLFSFCKMFYSLSIQCSFLSSHSHRQLLQVFSTCAPALGFVELVIENAGLRRYVNSRNKNENIRNYWQLSTGSCAQN